jgi:phosphosulfolactate synthase (CoM biosynthesis protein A)
MVLSLLKSNLQRLFYEDIVKKIINIYHESDVYVTTGGFIESNRTSL